MIRRRSKSHVTLRDVAAEAGVSLTTVSNFVNNRYRFMSARTRRKVQRAIEKLNYRPHGIARGLRLAEWRSIGIIIVDESPAYLANNITTYIVAGLSNFLSRHGFNLVVQGLGAADFESSPLISHLRTDGLCAMLSGRRAQRRALLDVLLRLNQPIVLFQDTFLPRQADICTAVQDDEAAGEMLARHVLRRGARRLVFLAPKYHNWAGIEARLRGIRQAARESGRAGEVRRVICEGREPALIWASLDRDFAAHGQPDAVLCNSDEMAMAVLKYLRLARCRVPQDVKVTGFNATGLSHAAIPTLTTVPSRGYELGEMAGEHMLTRLREGRFARRRIKLPLSLEVGEST